MATKESKAKQAAAKAAADAAAKAAADAAAAGKTEDEQKAAAAAAAAALQPNPDELVDVRVLVDCSAGKCNTLAQVRVAVLDELLTAGEVDDDPAAVEFVKALQA